jgi:hypothetical protein
MRTLKKDKVYDIDQYWVVYFHQIIDVKIIKSFRSFVKGKSLESAKACFLSKIEEEESIESIKSVKLKRVHSTFLKKHGEKLSIKEWEAFRKLSYPNSLNVLFKIECSDLSPNTLAKSLFSKKEKLKNNTNGFGGKYGKESWSYKNAKGKCLPDSLRPYYRYRGKWVKISDEERNEEKKVLISFAIKAKGNQSLMAKLMNKSRKYIIKYMKLFPEVDWKEFVKKE